MYTYSEMCLCCSGVYCCLVDHKQIISGGGDGYVMVWDTATGEHKQTLSGHKEEVVCIMQSLFHGTVHTNNYNQLFNTKNFILKHKVNTDILLHFTSHRGKCRRGNGA